MIIRLRGKLGTVRLDASDFTTIVDFKKEIAKMYSLDEEDVHISRDEKGLNRLVNSLTMNQGGLKHGDMLFLQFEKEPTESTSKPKGPETASSAQSKTTADDSTAKKEERLRDLKKHWTYAEFEAYLATKQVKIKSQAKTHATKIYMQPNAADQFQLYCRQFAFQRQRLGHCYGYISDQDEIVVHAIYEPPQECTDTTIQLTEDKFLETADEVFKHFGLSRVGAIIAHPTRKYQLSSSEIYLLCELQKDLGEKFAVLTASPMEDFSVQIQAFEIADLARQIHGEKGFLPSTDPTCCKTVKTAIVESKETHDVVVQFFFLNLPMEYLSDDFKIFNTKFPIENRIETPQNKMKLIEHLKGLSSKNILDKMADAHFLLYVVRDGVICGKTDIPVIAGAIVQKQADSLVGYEYIFKEIR